MVEINSPVTTYDGAKVYATEASAIAVLTGIYQEMGGEGIFQGNAGISIVTGLSADELMDYSTGTSVLAAAYHNAIVEANVPFWNRLYYFVYTTNTAIAGIENSKTLTPAVQQHLLGEAKFLRAFLYFYLTNLWGDVPMPLTNNYHVNSTLPRSTQSDVYLQIINDLIEAEQLMSEEYLLGDLKTATSAKIRPNKWVAKALLARVFLYRGNFEQAEAFSSEIIANDALFNLTPLENVFLNESKEAIWQIQSVSQQYNTFDAPAFVLNSSPNFLQPVSLSMHILNAFEPGDQRKSVWIGKFEEGSSVYYFPFKYKIYRENEAQQESLTAFRLAEQFLIRAEARAEQGKLIDAVADLNKIRKRARAESTVAVPDPLPDISAATDQPTLLGLIRHERQTELFTEWGHRWLDIKRTGVVDEVMADVSSQKNISWKNYMSLYPIPLSEITFNTNLTQNDGY